MAINRAAGLALPASTKWLIDDVIAKRQVELLVPIIATVLAATLIQGVTAVVLSQILLKAANRLMSDLRRRVHAHVGRLPVAFFDANRTGNLASRIMTDVEGVRHLCGYGLVDVIGGGLTCLLAIGVLLQINATLTVVVVVSMAIAISALQTGVNRMRPMFRECGNIKANVSGRLTESLGGVRIVKAYHAEEREHAVFAHGIERLLVAVLRTLAVTSVVSLLSSVLVGSVGAVTMYVGAREIMAGRLSVGGFLTYTLFIGYVTAPILQMLAIGTQMTEAIAGLDRIREILDESPEDVDPRRTVALAHVRGHVVFERVRFSYVVGREVLRGISFDARPGTATALVGSSGSGKSTITALIAAFAAPDSGTVLVDGVDLATVRLDSYRTRLGVVLQEAFLFDGTIYDNVAFSRPESSREEVLRACRIACVDEFTERFPDQYDTVVGERGVKLSGGQRQRISIARAILANPRILILDEATSSLDSESEQFIQQGLAFLMEGRTTFVIAHRLSTICRAHQILVVEGGQIVERGTHEDLLHASGRYAELYRKQHGMQEDLFLATGEGDRVPDVEWEVARAGLVENQTSRIPDGWWDNSAS
jgi:subfamily B ATP-binding cassette protein MsbA